jgi:hypothetical protein
MGNAQARKRVKAGDFQYIARNTAFLTNDVSTNNKKKIYFSKKPGGKLSYKIPS